MQPNLWVILVLVFLGTFGVTFGVVQWATGGHRMRSRLQQLSGEETPLNLIDTDPAFRLAARRDYFPGLSKMLRRQGVSDKLKLEMLRAGLVIRPSEYVAIILLSGALCGVLLTFLLHQPFTTLIGFGAGAGFPIAVVKTLQRVRRMKFEQQLADALSLTASSLRSGYSFLRSVQMVATEMPPPVSQECQRVLLEVEVGVPIEEALRRWVDRMQSYDLDLAVTAVIIQLQVGGNLADMLETISETIRERIRVRGEVAALTAEGRISGWILFFTPPILGVIMYILNPVYMRPLFTSPMGMPMIITALVLQVIGGLVIRKMLTLDI